MLSALLLLAALVAQTPPAPELPVLKAGLGSCSAAFTVKAADGSPAYAAVVHARIRYGIVSLKRMDVEVSTNDQGKALVDGLPNKAKPLTYDIKKGDQRATAEQNVSKECHQNFDISLK